MTPRRGPDGSAKNQKATRVIAVLSVSTSAQWAANRKAKFGLMDLSRVPRESLEATGHNVNHALPRGDRPLQIVALVVTCDHYIPLQNRACLMRLAGEI